MSPVLRRYLVGNALALAAFWFVPQGSWGNALWQAVVMSGSAVFLVVGVRRLRPEAAHAWYLLAAGTFLNGWGVVVDLLLGRWLGVHTRPNLADPFWSALVPAGVIGLGVLVRRAAAREDAGTTLRNTLICVPVTFFVGIQAWQFLAWRSAGDPHVALLYRVMLVAYPFGDLMFLGILLRLVLSVGLRNVAIRYLVAWFILLLPADIGWPLEGSPSHALEYLMDATWMAACVLLGAAAWHPDVRAISGSVEGRVPPLGGLGWTTLLACVLTAPLVVIFQAVLDRLYLLTSF